MARRYVSASSGLHSCMENLRKAERLMAIRKSNLYGKLETQDGKARTMMGNGTPFMESTLQTENEAITVRLYEDGRMEVVTYDGPIINASKLGKPTGQRVRRISPGT